MDLRDVGRDPGRRAQVTGVAEVLERGLEVTAAPSGSRRRRTPSGRRRAPVAPARAIFRRARLAGYERAQIPSASAMRLAVPCGVAEQRAGGLGPLHEQMLVVLPRVADAAEQLDAVRRHQPLAVAGGGLRGGDRRRAALVVLGDGGGGEHAHAPRSLDGDEHVRQLVLDRLERADRHAELLALLRVLEVRVEDRLARADELERDRGRDLLPRPLDALGADRQALAVADRGRVDARPACGWRRGRGSDAASPRPPGRVRRGRRRVPR